MITSIYIYQHIHTQRKYSNSTQFLSCHIVGEVKRFVFLSFFQFWNIYEIVYPFTSLLISFLSHFLFNFEFFFLFFIHLNQLNTSFSSHRTSHNLCTTCIAYMVNVVSCHLASILILRISLQFIYTKSNRNGIVHIVHQKRLKSTKYIGAIEIWTIATFSFCLVCLFENQLTNSRNKQTELHCAMCISRLYLNLSQSCRVNAIFRCHT